MEPFGSAARTRRAQRPRWRHARSGKPVFLVEPHRSILPSDVVQWLRQNPQIKRLNIAGNRESKNPGIGEKTERFLVVVFRRLVRSEQESQRRR